MEARGHQVTEQAFRETSPPGWKPFYREARYLYDRGEYDRGIMAAQYALRLAEEAQGPDHPDLVSLLANLATFYTALGRYDRAEPLYKRSLLILKKVLGPYHPHVAAMLENMAIFYRKAGRRAEAKWLEARADFIRRAR